MKILGISAHYHDSAAALVIDGTPVCAVQEERLSRRKNDAAFPMAAISWCLDHAGVAPEQLDAVVFYEKPLLKFERILISALQAFPRSWRSFPHAMRNALSEKLWIKGTITSRLGVPASKVLFTEHHQAHAAAAFFAAPARSAAILTADGVGEWATLTLGLGERGAGGSSVRLLREIRFPHSLGMLYSTFTAFLGFEVNEGEYKVMGLSSYGRPIFAEEVRRVLRRSSDGAIELDLDFFDFHTTARRSFSNRFIEVFGPPRDPLDRLDPRSPEGARFADIAASVQLVLEETLVDLAHALHAETGLADLCLGGGVALNGRANARILRESGFERVFVPPAPGDAGCALGAALYADRVHFGRPDVEIPDHPFWGPTADATELARLAREDDVPVETTSEAPLCEQVAAELASGAIVGWMEGPAELGPRALGHRSILAAPQQAATRDRLNRRIKRREEFRPFAPVVTAEDADRYFELPPAGDRLARFMSGVFSVRGEWQQQLAAVTHVDGTARVQVVDASMAPRLHRLLRAFEARTGLPVLLNTSFNIAGEPIVTTSAEGYSTFQRSDLDALVCGDTMIHKRPASGAVRSEET